LETFLTPTKLVDIIFFGGLRIFRVIKLHLPQLQFFAFNDKKYKKQQITQIVKRWEYL